MNQEDFIDVIKKDIRNLKGSIKAARRLKSSQIYELNCPYGPIGRKLIGIVRGFTHGLASMGVRVDALAVEGFGDPSKSYVIPVYASMYIKRVFYSDLPKYIGWTTTVMFSERLKDLEKYIKKEQST